MKKIIIMILLVAIVVMIYLAFKDDKVYYVALSNVSSDIAFEYDYRDYIVDYLDERHKLENYIKIENREYRVIDIIKDIEDNEEINNKYIQNILIKSDILTLDIGNADIVEKIKYYNNYDAQKIVDSYIIDLEKLFSLLRTYDKEDIIMLGYNTCTSNDEVIDYLNMQVKNLCDKYNIHFISIDDFNCSIADMQTQHIIFNRMRYIIDNNIKNK